MKREILSVWSLMARATMPLTLLICLLISVIEAVLFPLQSSGEQRLDTAFTDSAVITVFVIAMAALYAVMCLHGTLGTRNAIPFARLGVSDRVRFVVLAVQTALCLLILWAWQTGVAFALALWWGHAHPETVGQHTLLAAFYRVSFLHALLPLGDWLMWVRNTVLCAALGLCAAKAACTRHAVGPMIVGVLAALLWPTGISSGMFVPIQIALLAAAGWFAWMFGTEVQHETES